MEDDSKLEGMDDKEILSELGTRIERSVTGTHIFFLPVALQIVARINKSSSFTSTDAKMVCTFIRLVRAAAKADSDLRGKNSRLSDIECRITVVKWCLICRMNGTCTTACDVPISLSC